MVFCLSCCCISFFFELVFCGLWLIWLVMFVLVLVVLFGLLGLVVLVWFLLVWFEWLWRCLFGLGCLELGVVMLFFLVEVLWDDDCGLVLVLFWFERVLLFWVCFCLLLLFGEVCGDGMLDSRVLLNGRRLKFWRGSYCE